MFVSVTITLNLSDKTSAHNVSLLLPLNLGLLWYVNRKYSVITDPVSYLWAKMYVHICLPFVKLEPAEVISSPSGCTVSY